jgi:isocitrate dehydrogenase (NAD+)
VVNPYQFDVLVMENMFGDILSDLMAGLVGGLGLAPAGNIGKDAAMFEAVHGSAPDIAGKGIANPTSLTLAAAMLLEHVGQGEAATRVRTAVRSALADPATRTGDVGGKADTRAFTRAVVANLE